MKLTYVLLLFSFFAYGDDTPDYEANLRELRESQSRRLEEYKRNNANWQTLPNDAYELFYTQFLEKNLQEELALREEYCNRGIVACFTEQEIEAHRAQTRVAIGLARIQNQLSKNQRITAEQRQEILGQATRDAQITLCSQHDRGCDELPALDRRAADLEKQRDAELNAMEDEFAEGRPNWRENLGDPAVKDFLLSLEQARLEKTLTNLERLCNEAENKEDPIICLSENKKQAMREEVASASCQIERRHQIHRLVYSDPAAREEQLLSAHDAAWAALSPKNCETLLAADRGALPAETRDVASVDTPEVEEVNEDENNPRNYKPESCRWVTDLPRRVVYGPGCGPRNAASICTGYVVCEQKVGGGLFVRQSTCGPEHCGPTEEDAINCTKQQNHWSKKAPDSREAPSAKLKRVLSGGATQQ